jgi:hypothetical protein
MQSLLRSAAAASIVALIVLSPVSRSGSVPVDAATTSPSATPLRQIYHIVVRPMCTELRTHVTPAVGMMLQNDAAIAKSGPLFKDFIITGMHSDPSHASNYDTVDYDSPGRAMAVQRMEAIVPRLAQNVIAIQKILDNTTLTQKTGYAADDQQLATIRTQLYKVLATQSASLDLINGFVTTQQLGEVQHVGTEYLASINGTGLTSTPGPQQSNPNIQDPNSPGLPPNPYMIDPSQIPGLIVGYNPISKVADALEWVRGETDRRENAVAQTMTQMENICKTVQVMPSDSPEP